jgi:hypothetical protein
MSSSKQPFVMILALAMSLSAFSLPAAYADDGGTAGQEESGGAQTAPREPSFTAGTVDIGGGNAISVEQAAILPTDDGQIVVFTLNVQNNSAQDLQFINYWVRLESKSGAHYSVNLMPQDKDKNRIPAYSSQKIHFYSKVSSNVNLHDLKFRIIEWDFSAANFEREHGVVSISDDYSYVTPVDVPRTLELAGTTLRTSITRVTAGKNDKYMTPALTFRMENTGVKSAVIPDYHYYIRTADGLQYPLEAAGLSKDTAIYPRFDKEIQLTGTLPADTPTEGWQLLITQQDDTAKLTIPTAFYQMPQPDTGDTGVVGADTVKKLEVGSNTLETSVKKVITNKNDKMYSSTVFFSMKNTGQTSVSLPKYQFTLKTADGLAYPVAAELDNVSIDPQVSREIQLQASVPVEVSLDQARLVLSSPPPNPDDPESKGIPLAAYELPAPNQGQLAEGDTGEFSNADGTYTVRLNSVQRLPWEDEDVLAASVTLGNRGADSLPIPGITGYFLLDDTIEIPVQTVHEDEVVSIKKNGEIGLQLYGKIPYTNEYSSLKLVLQQKVDDKTTVDLLEFRHDSTLLPPRFVSVGDSFLMEGAGRNAELAINDVRTYEGVDGSLLTVFLNVQNREKRFANIPELAAYFKTSDGSMYPAEISNLKNKIGPNSVATLYVHAILPKDTKSEEVQLLVGEAVKEGGFDTSGEPDGYIKGALFAIPKENTQPKTDFKNLLLYPYTLSINGIKTEVLSRNQFRFALDYALAKSLLADGTDIEEHKLIIEVTDAAGSDLKFTRELSLGSDDGLAVGEHTKEFLITDEALLLRLPYLNSYKINIYDEFHGQKKLIATDTYNWFPVSE